MVTSRREFSRQLPDSERNIILTGDPEQEFDPHTYIWIYSYPELAIQNPLSQENFKHVLQFEDQFEPENPLDQLIQQRRRGRPQGSKNLTESWKNTVASEWKPRQTCIPIQNPDSNTSRTRSKHHVDQNFVNYLDN